MDTPNLAAGLLGPPPMSSVQTAAGMSSSWGEPPETRPTIGPMSRRNNVPLIMCVFVCQGEAELPACQKTISWARIRSVTTNTCTPARSFLVYVTSGSVRLHLMCVLS